jgi:hypothetical protein
MLLGYYIYCVGEVYLVYVFLASLFVCESVFLTT